MKEGDIMRSTIIFKIMSLIGITCLSIFMFAQENNRKQSIVNTLSSRFQGNWDKYHLPNVLLGEFNPEDIPIIYDIVFDRTIPYKIRQKSVWLAASLNPNQTQIDKVVKYVIDYLPSFNSERGDDAIYVDLKESIILLYRNSHNDSLLLKPIRTLYVDSACNDDCKMRILQLLSKTDSTHNIPFYNNILKHPGSDHELIALSAFGLAQSGSLESIPYLREMANYLFDTEENSKHPVTFILEANNMLRDLGSKHYDASKEIQEIITEVCNTDTDKYGISLKIPENVYDLFTALQMNGGEGNRKYLENLLDTQCKYQNAKPWAIKVLGFIGDEKTIDRLLPYANLYPVQVEIAIAEIQKRITK
jgi:hypothetical protein